MPVLFACLGLAVGSFLNVCIYRMPRGKSVVSPRSACPGCGRFIAWRDNIPLLSYLLLGGRCRFCRAPISFRYPLIEAATAGLFLWSYFYVVPATVRELGFAVFSCYLAASLLALSVIDVEFQLIPNRITYPLAVVGVGLTAFWVLALGFPLGKMLLRAALGAVVGGGSLWLVGVLGKLALRKEAMGMGDVKLMAAAGIWLGWEMVLFAIFLGALAGALVSLVLLLLGLTRMGKRLPFGPFLSIGIWICFLYGWDILFWYLGLYRG